MSNLVDFGVLQILQNVLSSRIIVASARLTNMRPQKWSNCDVRHLLLLRRPLFEASGILKISFLWRSNKKEARKLWRHSSNVNLTSTGLLTWILAYTGWLQLVIVGCEWKAKEKFWKHSFGVSFT